MRPSILTPTIATTMVLLIMKVLKYLRVTEDVDIGLLIPATLPLTITEFITVVNMVDADLGLKRPATIFIAIAELIILVLMVYVELGIKKPATLTLEIVDQDMMLMGDLNIGLRPETIPPITQAVMADC